MNLQPAPHFLFVWTILSGVRRAGYSTCSKAHGVDLHALDARAVEERRGQSTIWVLCFSLLEFCVFAFISCFYIPQVLYYFIKAFR
jgi:hypothetical protein